MRQQDEMTCLALGEGRNQVSVMKVCEIKERSQLSGGDSDKLEREHSIKGDHCYSLLFYTRRWPNIVRCSILSRENKNRDF